VKHVALCDILVPPHELDISDVCAQLQADISMFRKIQNTHYLNPRTHIEREKAWIDHHLGFRGTWRDGWVMYDGTIVVLYARPGLDGDAYYTHKSNYGLNLQVPLLCLFLHTT